MKQAKSHALPSLTLVSPPLAAFAQLQPHLRLRHLLQAPSPAIPAGP